MAWRALMEWRVTGVGVAGWVCYPGTEGRRAGDQGMDVCLDVCVLLCMHLRAATDIVVFIC